MQSVATLLGVVALLALGATTASAQYTTGGHDETSEVLLLSWVTAPPNPGVAPPPGPLGHLLISEVTVTPTAGEFIEICNPTGAPVDLSSVYLSDDWFNGVAPPAGYHRTPEAGYVVGVSSDFIARFPAGASIPPGGAITIAVDAAGFFLTYGISADYEILSIDPAVPDMVLPNGGGTNAALLTNSGEMVVLFNWDGVSDNICDIDYVQWGSPGSGNGVEKTGLAVDGPDADAIATVYLADTPVGSQAFLASPVLGTSVQRSQCAETPELLPGNGCTPGGPTPTRGSTWGDLKVLYR